MADNSHAERKIFKRRAQFKLRPAFSLSDAVNNAEIRREHQVLGLCLEDGDYPRYQFYDTSQGEREPE